jgi:flagellar hook-length control protein FliK
MIVVNASESKEPSSLSQLLLGAKGDEKGDKFAKLLEAMNIKGELDLLVSGKNSDPELSEDVLNRITTMLNDEGEGESKQVLKNATLMQLLQGESAKEGVSLSEQTPKSATAEVAKVLSDVKEETQLLHPKTINILTTQEIKTVITHAKQFLKTQIETIAREQNIDIKQMPRTLQGLSEMAQKLGVNLEKITLEEIEAPVKKESNQNREPLPLLNVKKQRPQIQAMTSNVTEQVKPEQSVKEDPLKAALQIKEEPVKRSKERPHVYVKEQTRAAVKEAGIQPQAQPKVKTESKQEAKTLHVNQLNDVKSTPKQEAKTLHVNQLNDATSTPKQTVISDDAVVDDTERVVLFKSNTNSNESPVEELLQSSRRETTTEPNVSKAPVIETKVAQNSVVSASSDSIEVKVKEAQQMVRHFATDLKEAVENYKPPFTRLKMTLNPVKLGEVDVTLIQRGNNVHINVSSNNTALTILAQNVTELKTQLANNGVVNTSMQFSTSHGEQQQRDGQHQQFQEFYKEFDQLSEEEIDQITSMEIMLPRYA